MYWLKGCPRCGRGDMVLDRDLWGWYRQCLQCSFLEDLPSYRLESGRSVGKWPVSHVTKQSGKED
ncbi:MAG: hypothetical protein ACE5JL_11280 [Dehalococcoidia bacterium]